MPTDSPARALTYRPKSARAFAATLVASLSLAAPLHAASTRFGDWTTVQSEIYGFRIAYPSKHFSPVPAPDGQDGRMMQSIDGKAMLLVATFENSENVSLDAYRRFLLSDIYPKAKIDYAPHRARWFVLSGVRGDETFYERVTFSCAGKLINSWVMLYPTAKSGYYNPMLEAIAKTYSAGSGADGRCNLGGDAADQTAAQPQGR